MLVWSVNFACFFFFKQKTAYEMRISDWSSDVCSSDLPLPKSLIYELLPSVDGLPRRLSDRSLAAELTAQLNYQGDSSLKGLIHQHTNPAGIIRDTAIQKVIMNSLGDGVMRELIRRNNGRDECRSEEHTSELQSLMRNSYAAFCLKKKN